MEVLGRDPAQGAYRVAIGAGRSRIVGLVPEALMASPRPLVGGHGHATAYDWIARHADEIEKTLMTLANGSGRPRAPFDAVTLAEE